MATTVTDQTLDKVVEIVRAELPKHLIPDESAIAAVHAQCFVGSDGEDVIRVRAVLTDDCPELDIPKVVQFIGVSERIFKDAGIETLVVISYPRSSEVSL